MFSVQLKNANAASNFKLPVGCGTQTPELCPHRPYAAITANTITFSTNHLNAVGLIPKCSELLHKSSANHKETSFIFYSIHMQRTRRLSSP